MCRKQKVPEDFLVKFLRVFRVDANWLLLGLGDLPNDYSPREAALVADYRAADEEDKRILERTGASFARSSVDGLDHDERRSTEWPRGGKKKGPHKRG